MPTLCVEGLAKLTGGAGDGNAFRIITCNYYTMWVVCVVVKFNGKITCSMAPRFTNEMDCGVGGGFIHLCTCLLTKVPMWRQW